MATRNAGSARPNFKAVTEANLRHLTDASSLSNGKSYYRNGYISRTALRGTSLTGLCQGSSGGPYRVEAELVPADDTSPRPLAAWDCTCPRGGFCKHVVALVLTWIGAPERFTPRQEVGELLATKSREELLSLLSDILEQHPELLDFVEAALPAPAPATAPGQGTRPTLDRKQIEAQVQQAFEETEDDYGRYNRYDEWGEGASVDTAVLTRLRRSADEYAAAGRWADAQLVYTAIIEGANSRNEESYYDEEGEVLGVVGECVAGLTRCLEAQVTLGPRDRLAARSREELLRTLYDAWSHSLDNGLAETDEVPELLARLATAEERATVEGWLRTALGPGGTYGRADVRREIVEFLLTLRGADGIDDEVLLDEYRAAGLWGEVAEIELRLGWLDEALATARQWLNAPAETLAFAARLLAGGGAQVERAFAFVEERLRAVSARPNQDNRSPDADAYLTWLGQQYGLHGRPDRALELAWRRFRATPTEQTYTAVKAAATLPDQPANLWPGERRKLLQVLEERGFWGVLVNIFLDEGEVGEALTALSELEQRPANPAVGYYGYWLLGDHRLRVARAAEQDYPERSIVLYQQIAQYHIDQRNRNNYQQAAEYLDRARSLYDHLGRYEEWRAFIGDLRDRHRTLRALRDELNARKLE